MQYSPSRLARRYDGKLSPGLKALGELPLAAWVQILGAIAVVELTVGKQDYENKVCSEILTSPSDSFTPRTSSYFVLLLTACLGFFLFYFSGVQGVQLYGGALEQFLTP